LHIIFVVFYIKLHYAICSLIHAICSFLKSESIDIRGLEGGLKAFKSFLKDKKRIKSKIKGYGTRFARVFLKSKGKSKSNYGFRYRSRLFKSKSARNRHFLGVKGIKSGNQRGEGRNLACSLVDTRSIRPCIV